MYYLMQLRFIQITTAKSNINVSLMLLQQQCKTDVFQPRLKNHKLPLALITYGQLLWLGRTTGYPLIEGLVDGLIPGFSNAHVKVSPAKTLNLKLLLECVCGNDGVCLVLKIYSIKY